MKILNSDKIIVSNEDDFLYNHLIDLIKQVKLAQGGTALDSTLRRHPFIRDYLRQKQKNRIKVIEDKYFNEDGTLNQFSIEDYHHKMQLASLQK